MPLGHSQGRARLVNCDKDQYITLVHLACPRCSQMMEMLTHQVNMIFKNCTLLLIP